MLHHQSFILYPFPAPINRSSALLIIHSHFSSHKSAVLIQCSWQFCHRILIRPHPAVWRLVHGLAVVYLVALTFLLFQVSQMWGFSWMDTVLLSLLAMILLVLATQSEGHTGSYLFLISQNRDDARQFMKLLHPDLGVGKISAPNSFTRNVIYFFLFLKKTVVIINLLSFQCRIAREILWS